MKVYNAEWMANCLKMVRLTQTSLVFYFSLDDILLINFATSLKLLFFVGWTIVICDIRGYLEKETEADFRNLPEKQGQGRGRVSGLP